MGSLWSPVTIERVSGSRSHCRLFGHAQMASERWVFPCLRGNVFRVLGLDGVGAQPVFKLVERLIYTAPDGSQQLYAT